MARRKHLKISRSTYIAEMQEVDPVKLPNKLWPTKAICSVYRLSPYSMRNYRKGFYFKANGEIKWITPNHDKLKHIGQGQEPLTTPGGDVKYTIPWVNDFLRKIGRADRIPTFLRHL